MKLFKLLSIVLCLTCFNLLAQENGSLKIPEHKAEPYEGFEVFYQNFISKLNIDNVKDKDVVVLLQFAVDTDGSFTDIHIKKDELGLGIEVIRTLKSMPKWKPAFSGGKPVKASFNIPIKIRVKDNTDLVKDITVYENVLKKYEQVTNWFKFSCNCVTSSITSEPDGSSDLYQYETIDKIGLYNISVSKFDKKDQKKYFKNLILDLKKSLVNYEKVVFGNSDAISVYWIDKNEGVDYYYRTIFFFENDKLFSLNFGSNNSTITDLVFTNLLNSFQIKE